MTATISDYLRHLVPRLAVGMMSAPAHRLRDSGDAMTNPLNSRLRDEIDLGALDAEPRGVVTEAMPLARVSLWLRGPEATP